ncbi:hypothetical protein B0H14DRAFT_644793 [Mycena olivaceomarginata]|nr:hypothetical protein B0H14DRAFT_644793 [Mycena olivaceomarginata]
MGCGRRPRSPPRLSSNSRMFPSAPVFKRFHKLCGALFVSVGQNVFQNKLISGLVARVPSVNPKIIFLAGATNLKNAVDPKFITEVISAGDGFPSWHRYVGGIYRWSSGYGVEKCQGQEIEMGMA